MRKSAASGSELEASTSRKTATKQMRWHQRPSVRTLKKQLESEDHEWQRNWDKRENAETRLPASEAIHLGGLVLTEAFTPSTVSSLYRTLRVWPSKPGDRKEEWLDQLARSRSGEGGGWQNLGPVRPPGTFTIGGHHDPTLPSGVDAVWLQVSYVTPALAMVVGTFTLAEKAGDLSALLRQDYETRRFDIHLTVSGRFGDVRARIPFARPAMYGTGYSSSMPEFEKRDACLALMNKHEEACAKWFYSKFPGRFAAAGPDRRPLIRLLFTKETIPYSERHPWLRPVALDFALPLWRSVSFDGWWLAEERWPGRDRRPLVTLSAKRSDAAPRKYAPEPSTSNWVLTQTFGHYQASLAARHGILALLSLYADRLGALRDQAGVQHRLRRSVREARALDDYLIRDGLDAATITSDLNAFTEDLTVFRWEVPEFVEVPPPHQPASASKAPVEYVPWLCRRIRERTERLATDTRATTGNVRASAELRQAIANTTLQRLILLFSTIAVIIAIISLLGSR